MNLGTGINLEMGKWKQINLSPLIKKRDNAKTEIGINLASV